MAQQFILRFDDIHPRMDWNRWSRVEKILDRYKILPIVAVIPDNQDTSLIEDVSNPDFWQLVRGWKDKGWSVAMHGCDHIYRTNSAGIIGLNARSEFAGQPEEWQREQLTKGVAIFKRERIEPWLWVAPSHSFDLITIKILRELGFTAISDGFYFRIVLRNGMSWIPQQIWRFQKYGFGIWTVCYHVQSWSEKDFSDFENNIKRYKEIITHASKILSSDPVRNENSIDRLFRLIWQSRIKLATVLKSYVK